MQPSRPVQLEGEQGPLTAEQSKAILARLEKHGALIGGVWSTIGSTNLDWRSFTNNHEVNAVLLGQEFGAQMQAMFEKDLESSRLITL